MDNKKLFKKILGSVLAIVILAGIIGGGVYLWQNKGNQEATKIEEGNTIKQSKLLYKKGSDLMLYDTATGKKEVVLSSSDLIDYSLSEDGIFVAYTLKEPGFDGNSDIYLKSLSTGETARLTEQNNIASMAPKIFPDDSKVVYTRKAYDSEGKNILAEEIWTIDVDGDPESSQKLYSSKGVEDFLVVLKDGAREPMSGMVSYGGITHCIYEGREREPFLKVSKISPDSKSLVIEESDAGNCEGGMFNGYSLNSTENGSSLLTEKFVKQNIHSQVILKSGNEDVIINGGKWSIFNIFPFEEGDFAVSNILGQPLDESSLYYYDKNQDKKWEVFDSLKRENKTVGIRTPRINAEEIFKKNDTDFLVLYRAYYYNNSETQGADYYIENLGLGDEIAEENISNEKPFLSLKGTNQWVSDMYILNEDTVIYRLEGRDSSELYSYKISSEIAEKIDEGMRSDLK